MVSNVPQIFAMCIIASTAIAWSPTHSKLPPHTSSRFPSTTTSLLSSITDREATSSIDERYYTSSSFSDRIGDLSLPSLSPSASSSNAKITLTRWLSAKVQDFPELRDMESLATSIQMACKTISNLIQSSSTSKLSSTSASVSSSSARDNSMKRLDQLSKNVLQNALRFTGRLRVVEAPRSNPSKFNSEEGVKEHQPGVTVAYALDQYGKDGMRKKTDGGGNWGNARRLAACFDPLDGSGNADAQICTGTVFGVFDADAGFKGGSSPDLRDPNSLTKAVLQPGSSLLAAGYCLYSSTTMLVFSLGGGTHGFTLDSTINEFVLTHPNMQIPKRGNIYSCNEAYSEGWDGNFMRYLKALKTGKGETKQRYTQRYIGSMVGDVHRTLMYGGIFCCPADTEVHHKGNLQLVYKSAPMAFILEHAGGKASNGKVSLLSVQPEYVHERSPCFMGSPDDMDELATYLGR